MGNFDTQKFAAALKANALPPFGRGQCAKYVRLALESAGADTTGHPVNAKEYGPTLERIGFQSVTADGYAAQCGDIAVIQSTSDSVPGHIEGFDGTNWVSDFIQAAFWPGPSFRNETPAYVVYRWPG